MCGREVLAGLYLSGLSTKPVRALPGHVIFLIKISPSSEETCLVLSSLCFVGGVQMKWGAGWGAPLRTPHFDFADSQAGRVREDVAYEQQPCTPPRLPAGSVSRPVQGSLPRVIEIPLRFQSDA